MPETDFTAPSAQKTLINKLRALARMADEASTPDEAALASRRMQELLLKHNLTRADIEAKSAEDESAPPPEDAQRERLTTDRPAMYKYQRDLMETIALNNFCMYWSREKKQAGAGSGWMYLESKCEGCGGEGKVGGKLSQSVACEKCEGKGTYQKYVKAKWVKVHEILGRSENVVASVIMYNYLIETMHRLLPYRGVERRSAEANMWLAGCAEVLCGRLVEQRRGREKRVVRRNQTPGLVRLTDLYGTEEDLNNDFRRGVAAGTTAKERLEEEREVARIKAKEKELVTGGMDQEDAWYVARDYDVPDRSPSQVVKESRPRSYSGRSSYSGWSRWDRERQRREHPSFRAGQESGKGIGLGGALKKGDSSRKQLG
jgi:hypothetical protein